MVIVKNDEVYNILVEKLFNPAEVRAFNALPLADQQQQLLEKYQANNPMAAKEGLVLVGDSLVEFLPNHELDLSLPVYNRGIRGIGSQFLLEHLSTLVLDLAPQRVLLLIGTNDLMFGMTPEVLVNTIEKIVDKIQRDLPQCQIFLQSLYPRRQSAQWGAPLTDDILVTNLYLRQLSGVTYLDVHSLLADINQELCVDYTRDGVHLNRAGYLVVLDALQQYI